MGDTKAVSHDRHHNLRLVSSQPTKGLSPEAQNVLDKLSARGITAEQLNTAFWILKELDAEGFDQETLFRATREIKRRGFIVELL